MAVRQRDDSRLGPISLDQIEYNLYLGGLAAARDLTTLGRHKITHIITIDVCPLPRQILEQRYLTTKHIHLSDQPTEDLLSYLDDTYEFIANAICDGPVFVHCYFGISRSATVVIAYIMKKYKLTYEQAFDRVRAKRSRICPNYGFVSQLKLYQEMNYMVDKSHMKYRLFRLGMAAERVKKVKILPQNYHDLIKSDPGLTQIDPEPNVYRCKRCRRVLASASNLLLHKDAKDESAVCKKTYFIEPLAWMNVTQLTQGKLLCPKCEVKVGSFCWMMGCQCPCGVQMAPAFYLMPSKVDFTYVVKNVEMTF